MKVMITGAFGYFGLALVQRLAERHEVIAVGRAPRTPAVAAVRRVLPQGVEAIELGVQFLTYQRMRDVDAVVHLAGGGAPGGDLTDARGALRDNVESAAHLAAISRSARRRILASSIYVYGRLGRPSVETDTLAPDTLYGALKVTAEAVWRQSDGHSLRFAHIWGAGSGVDFLRDGVTERLARAAAGGAPFVLHGDGRQRLDLVHIDDACRAVALALEADALPAAVNIGGGGASTIRQIRDAFDREAMEAFECTSYSGTAYPCRELDVALAAEVLGWAPSRPTRAQVQALVRMVGGEA